MCEQIVALHRFAGSCQVIGRGANNEPLLAKLTRDEIRKCIECADTHREIDSLADEIHRPILQRDGEIQPRKSPSQIHQCRHDMPAAKSRRKIDAQAANRLFVARRQKGFCLVQTFEDASAREQESLARGRQVNAARRPVQQLHTEPHLQPRDVLADRGTGKAQQLASGGKAAALSVLSGRTRSMTAATRGFASRLA